VPRFDLRLNRRRSPRPADPSLRVDEFDEQLGLPVTTVRGRLARARAKLARELAAEPEGALSPHE